jgi:hypothetical protein
VVAEEQLAVQGPASSEPFISLPVAALVAAWQSSEQ